MFLQNFVFPMCIASILLSQAIGRSPAKHKITLNSHKRIESGVPEKDVEIILKKHNSLRTSLTKGKVKKQPKGVNIQNMTWDASLAPEAQNIVNSCIYKHVKVKDDRWYVGQNLYSEESSELKKEAQWDKSIQVWFDEHKTYEYCVFDVCNDDAGHYTQVVWAETKYVGCGYCVYETKEHSKYEKLYLCNYGPGGNMVGEYPYKKG